MQEISPYSSGNSSLLQWIPQRVHYFKLKSSVGVFGPTFVLPCMIIFIDLSVIIVPIHVNSQILFSQKVENKFYDKRHRSKQFLKAFPYSWWPSANIDTLSIRCSTQGLLISIGFTGIKCFSFRINYFSQFYGIAP